MALRDLLAEPTLRSWVKTSGSKGFHIVVPLDRKAPLDGRRALLPTAWAIETLERLAAP